MKENYIEHLATQKNDSSLLSDSHIKNEELRKKLGGKGMGLVEMSKLGISVPSGFIITTDLCKYYYKNGAFPENFIDKLKLAIAKLENVTGKKLGDANNPLLLSVRSGSVCSMPGMMDSVLNVGINLTICKGLIKLTNNDEFAIDCYKRFLRMYTSIVLGLSEKIFEKYDHLQGLELVEKYEEAIITGSNKNITFEPFEQLLNCIEAVLKSWNNPRAIAYRKIYKIPDHLGTAVNVQSMIFGNNGNSSGTGVVFTRSPSTGENNLFGEFLINAQGEDIVSGKVASFSLVEGEKSMKMLMPKVFKELEDICKKLELYYLDMQDIEFTVDNGSLYILQTRNGKRNIEAEIKIAVDLVKENIISKSKALMRINPNLIGQLLHNKVNISDDLNFLAKGLPVSPGAASGIIVFSAKEAETLSKQEPVILIKNDINPEDINAMQVASAIVTIRGGMTSHAAVVTRGMGKPCICAVNNMSIDEEKGLLNIGNKSIPKYSHITIDGSTGEIFLGKANSVAPEMSQEFKNILQWSDEIKKLTVRVNAETVKDIETGLKFGASGIGLCRTEHMFFDEEKISLFRKLIISQDVNYRSSIIEKLLIMQKTDFQQIFLLMDNKSVNIRLLDPPLHEFLPKNDHEINKLSADMKISVDVLKQRIEELHEINPMLGHRGCRLGVSYPEIYEMQLSAIFQATKVVKKELINLDLEIMIPFISDINELYFLKNIIEKIAKNYRDITYKIGTMIELPRAVLQAKKIAKIVDYFSFGTNDLTQTVYGISREDIKGFLDDYLLQNIFTNDPFSKIDEEGVGELIKIAIKNGKIGNKNLKLGICGEHAGDPESIDFFNKLPIEYISCSPYRIPVARIAAAQACIRFKNEE